MRKPKVSVIIPVRTITPYLRETVGYLLKQTQRQIEIIVVTDGREKLSGVRIIASGDPTPAYKRNLGVKRSSADILAFLDDDSYPEKNWVTNALKIFGEGKAIAAVCGPTLIPPEDNFYQRVSGLVWASWLGSAGAGTYRNRVMPRREVDDFPSVNLLARRKDFVAVGGFDINHWPGEDTKLCLDLVNSGKKIIYDPGVIVYHHRRAILLPHLKQLSRYALRRGHFARIFPQTSFKFGYFAPSIFAYGLVFGLLLSFIFPSLLPILSLSLAFYYLLLLESAVEVFLQESNLLLALAVMPAIVATHLTYGFLFPFGFLQRNLKTVPHAVDNEKKIYLGG